MTVDCIRVLRDITGDWNAQKRCSRCKNHGIAHYCLAQPTCPPSVWTLVLKSLDNRTRKAERLIDPNRVKVFQALGRQVCGEKTGIPSAPRQRGHGHRPVLDTWESTCSIDRNNPEVKKSFRGASFSFLRVRDFMESGFLWLERQPQCYAGKQPISCGATNRWEASLQFYEAKLCFAFKVHAFMLSTVTQSMWNRVEIFVFFFFRNRAWEPYSDTNSKSNTLRGKKNNSKSVKWKCTRLANLTLCMMGWAISHCR